MSTVDLEAGRPTVKEALQHFDARLAAERMLGVRLMKVIHGYGSSGVGGATKTQLHRHLENLQKSGQIKGYVRGEDYSQMTAGGRKLLNDFPQLKSDVRSDSSNPGITFVILRS